MIRRNRNRIILFLSFQAMAVAIICCGSLINFHQYKIWGKPLIPNFVGYKRDIEKYTNTSAFSKQAQGNQYLQNGFAGSEFDHPVAMIYFVPGGYTFISSGNSCQCLLPGKLSSTGLRGPPVS